VTLIPPFGAAGAAAANMIAEFTVMLVQIVMLRKEVLPSLRKIQYWKLGLGLLAATGASFWVAALPLGSFFSLALSAVLFFLAYGLVLLVLKERLVCEVLGQMLHKFKRKK
ncbi:MAG: polysaccharide biosynthesis C-terminal domain-containing protein, partial [Oscillospiraceae bacterium]|nr:polysaccharide biosynthesis C-terminal domain-containing protein [Oscillospiraceae bacterium]